MSENLEIEFKNMLDENEYQALMEYFEVTESELIKQTNIYYDTSNLYLKDQKCALRVRIKDNQFELTLKEPQEVGLLETNDPLTEEEFKILMELHTIPHRNVYQKLLKRDISEDLVHLASLTTYRYETTYKGQTLAIDKSLYYNQTDYEMELETENYETGKQVFNELLNQFDIETKPSQNKIMRAYHYKLSLNK